VAEAAPSWPRNSDDTVEKEACMLHTRSMKRAAAHGGGDSNPALQRASRPSPRMDSKTDLPTHTYMGGRAARRRMRRSRRAPDETIDAAVGNDRCRDCQLRKAMVDCRRRRREEVEQVRDRPPQGA